MGKEPVSADVGWVGKNVTRIASSLAAAAPGGLLSILRAILALALC